MSDFLLLAILIFLIRRAVQAERHQKQLIDWLDSFADMTGDQRRELINQIKKGRQ